MIWYIIRRIVLRHIVPNTVGIIVVNATFQIADAILLLALLSFLGDRQFWVRRHDECRVT